MHNAEPTTCPHAEAPHLTLRPGRRRGAITLLLSGASVSLFTAPAEAQDRYVNLTVSTQYDDNLQRLPNEQKALQPHNGQEIVTWIGADAGAAADFGLIDVRVDGSIAKRLFAHNEALNSDEYRLAARADYQALSGSAAVNALISRQNLSFNDPLFRGTSVRNLMRYGAEGDRRLIGNVRLAGSASFQSSSSPNAVLSRADNQRYSYSLGLRYVSPLENRFELGYSESIVEGESEGTVLIDGVPALYSSDATDRSVYAELRYAPSVLLSVTARAGYTWHDDRSVLNADFKGLTQAASVRWLPIESVSVVAATNRSFSSNDELFANGVKSTSHSLSVQGRAWDRVTITTAVSRAERNFRYDLQADTPSVAPRNDRFWVFEAGSRYQTGIGVDVGVQFRHTSIRDTAVEGTIKDNSVMLSLSRRFSL